MGNNDEELRKQQNWLDRRVAWTTLMAFSAIVLGAFLSSDWDRSSARHKWVIAATSTSTALAFFAWVAHRMAKHQFLGSWEGATALLVLAVWAGALPIIMGPSNNIAVDGFTIADANVYFFSWLSALAATFVVASVAEYDLSKTSPQMRKWYIFCFASIVVMTSSIRHYRNETGSGTAWSRRVKFGIGLGAGATFFGFLCIWMGLKDKLSTKLEVGMSLMLFLMYACGVAFLTFGGSKGPGTQIGNLYFSTWIAFAQALMMCSYSFAKYKSEQDPQAEDDIETGEKQSVDTDDSKHEEVPETAPERSQDLRT